jgi:hypothetical protein
MVEPGRGDQAQSLRRKEALDAVRCERNSGQRGEALVGRAQEVDHGRHGPDREAQSTSNTPAAPMPPPMHIVTTTFFAPRRLPSMSAWPVSRWPLTP